MAGSELAWCNCGIDRAIWAAVGTVVALTPLDDRTGLTFLLLFFLGLLTAGRDAEERAEDGCAVFVGDLIGEGSLDCLGDAVVPAV